ncbi:hypothetical protein EGW08_003284 [Elysia chlorotica]|uniref:Uncharacterized protein n=1 Tax=Elysia chlorotica TaxID=188477 RepID=A0A3S1HYY5_ELYCH|nr:hypothetical protein EGW08_003284 [Elysia chlorotica]
MAEASSQGCLQHKEASSDDKADTESGTAPSEHGSDSYLALQRDDPVNFGGTEIKPGEGRGSTSRPRSLNSSSSKSIFHSISELILPPQPISSKDNPDSRQTTVETNRPREQGFYTSRSNQSIQSSVSTTYGISEHPNQPKGLYTWSQSCPPSSTSQIQRPGRSERLHITASSSLQQANYVGLTDCSLDTPKCENNTLYAPSQMQAVTSAIYEDTRFEQEEKTVNRPIEMHFSASGLQMPMQESTNLPYTARRSLTTQSTYAKRVDSNVRTSSNQNKGLRRAKTKPKIPYTMILSYVLSLVHQCSVRLIPLDAFESAMTECIEQYSGLILHYSECFKSIVNTMMTNLASHHSPNLFPRQVNPPHNLLAWGSFKIPRDKFGRQQESDSLSKCSTTADGMFWTRHFKASVVGLCKKIHIKVEETPTVPIKLPDTSNVQNPSAASHQYVSIYNRSSPLVENETAHFSGPSLGTSNTSFKHGCSMAVSPSVFNSYHGSLNTASRLGSVTTGCMPLLPPYCPNEKQNAHTDSSSVNSHALNFGDSQHPSDTSAGSRWGYSRALAAQNAERMEHQDKENATSAVVYDMGIPVTKAKKFKRVSYGSHSLTPSTSISVALVLVFAHYIINGGDREGDRNLEMSQSFQAASLSEQA